jgi:hypothetical protein
MQMSVRFSFKRSGEMIGSPRMTYFTEGASADTRATYLKAINASLDSCLPLKFSGDLGGAIAGRPIAIPMSITATCRSSRVRRESRQSVFLEFMIEIVRCRRRGRWIRGSSPRMTARACRNDSVGSCRAF